MAAVFEPVSESRAGPRARSEGGVRWDQPVGRVGYKAIARRRRTPTRSSFLWGELRLGSVKELFFLQSGCLEEAREVAAPSSCASQGFCPRLGLSHTPTPSLTPILFAARPLARREARVVLSVASYQLWPLLCRYCNVMSGCYRSRDSGTVRSGREQLLHASAREAFRSRVQATLCFSFLASLLPLGSDGS